MAQGVNRGVRWRFVPNDALIALALPVPRVRSVPPPYVDGAVDDVLLRVGKGLLAAPLPR